VNILASLTRQFKGETLTLGLDIGSRGVKAVMMRHFANGRMVADRAAYVPIQAGVIRDGQIVAADVVAAEEDNGLEGISPKEWIKQALVGVFSEIGFSPSELDICVSPPWMGGLLVDRITLPEKSDIATEAKKGPPFDGTDIVLDHQVLGYIGESEKQRQADVLLAAARNRVVLEWSALFREIKAEPMAFDADIFALYNAWLLVQSVAPVQEASEGTENEEATADAGDDDSSTSQHKALAILSVGMQRVVVTFVVDGNFHSSREVTGASLTAFQRTLTRRANLDADADVEAMLRSEEHWPKDDDFFRIAYRQAATDLGSGVQQAVQYFHSANPGMSLSQILLCGGGARVPGLSGMLSKKLRLPVEVFDPMQQTGFKFRKKSSVTPELGPLMATAYGLATRRF